MQYTTLRFPSMKEIWQFVKQANIGNYHFDTRDYTLRASLTDEQIWTAMTHFKAIVHERQSIA